MNEEQKFRNRMLMIFQQFDMLDNYTDFNWFANLDIIMLKKMYAICEDIWNYRAQLTFKSKKNIVYNGCAFTIHPNIIQTYHNKRSIQNIGLHVIIGAQNTLLNKSNTTQTSQKYEYF